MSDDLLKLIAFVVIGIVIIYLIINFWAILLIIAVLAVIILILYYYSSEESEDVECESNDICVSSTEEIVIDAQTDQRNNFDHENILKGELFEECVKKLFSEEHFDILFHTPSAFDPHSTKEEVMKPDLLIKERETGNDFWVECKYKSKPKTDGSIEWSDYKHKRIYEKCREETQNKVYIAIGVGGDPSHPNKIIFLDLDRTPYTNLFKSFYENYEIHPKETIYSINRIPYKTVQNTTNP